MTVPLWTWTELVAAARGRADGAADGGVSGVSIDTRTLQPGDLFVALKDQRDGHEFVTAAFKSGAAAALVSDDYARQPGDGALLRTGDPLAALENIGRASRARLAPDARVIAVTGSAGKTGTKEMLRACLSLVGGTHASEKSYNNHWGVPLTLARMNNGVRYAVFEVGMNHAGEIRPLAKMVRPQAAIITTVEAVHLEYFPNVEAIADAKGEIFEGLAPGGVAIIKSTNPQTSRLVEIARRCGARPVTFGLDANADVSAEDFELLHDRTRMTAKFGGRRLPIALAMPGRHIAENALAVIAALDAVGADIEAAVAVLATLGPPPGRGQRLLVAIGGGTALLIDESYNANPASMRAALTTLDTTPREEFARRIAVLGDMLELGPDAAALHRSLEGAVLAAGVDLIFACGPYMKGLYDALPERMRGRYAPTAAGLGPELESALKPGDVIMIKGSNGTKLGPLVENLKSRLAERSRGR
ncbi:MAG: UDP-N-acetylmuramoylalanyl-D-glutamyl-2,6-diaminopimelate--D-alanyl-D-alanine ligase [Hyphomicrobium sp.]